MKQEGISTCRSKDNVSKQREINEIFKKIEFAHKNTIPK